jgi:uncharacterized membrane protein YozB (DUF420 family)
MATYLGLSITTVATINLILQTIAYIILLMGFRFARKNNFSKHGIMMGTATLLIFISLAVVMLASFYSIISAFSFNLYSSMIILHHSLGLVTLIMAIVAILYLRPCGTKRGNQKLGNVRKYMITLITLWSITYFFGIFVYLILYSPFH